MAKFLQTVGVNDERQAVLVGSSFGGLLAANVAHQVLYCTASCFWKAQSNTSRDCLSTKDDEYS